MYSDTLILINLSCYNGEKHLLYSIENYLNQTYRNIELIIVKNCSVGFCLLIGNYSTRKDNLIQSHL